MKKVKGLLKKSLRKFSRDVAEFLQGLDFFVQKSSHISIKPPRLKSENSLSSHGF